MNRNANRAAVLASATSLRIRVSKQMVSPKYLSLPETTSLSREAEHLSDQYLTFLRETFNLLKPEPLREEHDSPGSEIGDAVTSFVRSHADLLGKVARLKTNAVVDCIAEELSHVREDFHALLTGLCMLVDPAIDDERRSVIRREQVRLNLQLAAKLRLVQDLAESIERRPLSFPLKKAA
ncbi:MAG: hypothetical protein WA705_02695 [Candidatus Ozemobacteraceae bacterium]